MDRGSGWAGLRPGQKSLSDRRGPGLSNRTCLALSSEHFQPMRESIFWQYHFSIRTTLAFSAPGVRPVPWSPLFGSLYFAIEVAILGLSGFTSRTLSFGSITKSMSSIGITPRST